MRNTFIGVWIFFVLGSSTAQAQYSFNEPITKAYKEILLLKIKSANKILAQFPTAQPANGCALLVANYADLVTLMLVEDKNTYKKLLPNKEARLENLKKCGQDSPYYKYIRAEILFQWGIINFKWGNNVDATIDLIKAYNLLVDNKKEFPDFIYTYKTLALFHIVLGNIPEKNQYMVRMFGFDTDANLGQQELKKSYSENTIFEQEVLYIYCMLDYFVYESTTYLPQLEKIITSQPQNQIAGYLYASILSKSNKGNQALKILSQIRPSDYAIDLPYIHYLKGNLQLQKGDYLAAKITFTQFLKIYKGQNYIKDSYYKLALAATLMGDLALANSYRDSVIKFGTTQVEPDKHAQANAINYKKSDTRLLEAMLRCDGGYLQEANHFLDQINIHDLLTLKDKIEYLYRKGRVLQMLKMEKNAAEYYLKVVVSQKGENYYFAPNSCLQLGYMYAESQPAKARMYFKKVLDYADYEYENGIKEKAKIALKKL